MYSINKEVKAATNIKEAWKFISNPANLNLITPKDLDFRIISPLPKAMYNGLLIEYQINLPFLGKRTWVSEIKHIDDGRSFVDEQRLGPYSFWFHYHLIEPIEHGVLFTDKITYEMPLGIFGRISHGLFVKKELERIFNFREQAIRNYFNDKG